MGYTFSNDQPIYLQLMDIYKQMFVRREILDSEQLPSVRDVALQFGVNPNTVQKAFAELDREGFTRSERTAGRFVTLTEERRSALQTELAREYITVFLEKMKALGLTTEEIQKMIGGKNDENTD